MAVLLRQEVADAQISPATSKKRVYRQIDLVEKETGKANSLTPVTSDSLLVHLLVTAVMNHTITAYTNDPPFGAKLTEDQISDKNASVLDSMFVIDPVTNKEVYLPRKSQFEINNTVTKYRIMEDWTFDPATGKTTVEIVGVGPVWDMYGDDGVFRGRMTMFWVKYQDALPIIRRYEQYHPESTIAGKIWGSYFLSDEKPRATV
jgi:hypothetical protein